MCGRGPNCPYRNSQQHNQRYVHPQRRRAIPSTAIDRLERQIVPTSLSTLIAQQDAEYEEALRKEQERELKKEEKEKQHREREQTLQNRRFTLLSRQPAVTDSDCVRVKIRMPTGEVVMHRFRSTNTMDQVYEVISVQPCISDPERDWDWQVDRYEGCKETLGSLFGRAGVVYVREN